jgi:transposase
MFALTASQRFFLYSQPVDMRKSFDALSGIVTIVPEAALHVSD